MARTFRAEQHEVRTRGERSDGVDGSKRFREAFAFGNPEMNERMIRRTALRRAGDPQDIANAIAFLCSDLAGYVTGVELNVSGGIELFTF